MNKRIFFNLLVSFFAIAALAGCSKEPGIDPSSAEPVIAYPYDKLVADLNMVDNLPVVAVVKSEAGLKSVELNIRTVDGELIAVKTVTDFFDRNSYSLSEKINYKPAYTEAVVTAIDRLDRKVELMLPIEIVDVVLPPSIVFTPESINYDETVGGPMPRTHFEVSTAAQLRLVEMFRVTTSGQTLYSSVSFTEEQPTSVYDDFDEQIQYNEFDKGFKVRAVDNYGQVRIVTLPIKYKTVPPPVVTFASNLIMADKDEQKSVNIAIESQAGVVKVELYRLEGATETKVKTTTYEALKTLNYAEAMTFTNTTTGVKVIVTDNVSRTTTASTKAYVNLYYAAAIEAGTAPVADDGQINRLISLSDLTTYSVEECFATPALQARVDLKVYYMNGNAASVRIYSMENGDSKNAEYSFNGKNIGLFSPINATRFRVLDASFDFDAATAADIAEIDPASIQSSNIKGKDELIGSVIAFKAASTSAVGAGKVGIMKLVSISEKIGTNANARTFTFSVKLPKE